MQAFEVSAAQADSSVCALQGSTVVEPPPLTVVEPSLLQTQSHGGQVSPGAHAGHAQAQVPGCVQPGPPSSQLHAQGGQASPGAHAGHAQLHAPPLPPLPRPNSRTRPRGSRRRRDRTGG